MNTATQEITVQELKAGLMAIAFLMQWFHGDNIESKTTILYCLTAVSKFQLSASNS